MDVLFAVVLFGSKAEIAGNSSPDELSATIFNGIEVFKFRALSLLFVFFHW